MRVNFTVMGKPVPQGSMKAFIPRGWTRPVLTSDNPGLKAWRKNVSAAATAAIGGKESAGRHVPLRVTLAFYLTKAPSNKLAYAVKRPDLDKLTRAALDGMTGVIYDDDSQVTELVCSKWYGVPARVEVAVEELSPALEEASKSRNGLRGFLNLALTQARALGGKI